MQEFAAKHPYAAGRTAVFGQSVSGTLQVIVAPDAQVNKFLSGIGLTVPVELDQRAAYALLQPNPATTRFTLDTIEPAVARLAG
jgi:hypothetical protein